MKLPQVPLIMSQDFETVKEFKRSTEYGSIVKVTCHDSHNTHREVFPVP
jgi:hypothetical protein